MELNQLSDQDLDRLIQMQQDRKKAKNDLTRTVELHNESSVPFQGKWDGKLVVIQPGRYRELKAGVAEHFIGRYPNAALKLKEIPTEVPETVTPQNPLESDKKSDAFSALKKDPDLPKE